jgi:RHH-type transcriptional regulator, proline utilization regulon repressor / proline dehydrogenase / delta 1-pyrroline-5-carboxylate dehydrogenase
MSLNTTQIPIPASAELADAAIEMVKQWVAESKNYPVSASSKRLAGLLQDPNGLEFAVGFVDGVIRPEDKKVAAKNFYKLRGIVPKFLPLGLRILISLGTTFALLFPFIVIPIARKALRSMVSHLVVDASVGKLGSSLRRITKSGARLNINMLGEAVLGEQEAKRKLIKTAELLTRKDVDYVSIKVSSTVAPHSKWAFNENVDHVVERLSPLYELAVRDGANKFINLDMEEYHDLDLTIAVFKRILSNPKFKNLEAGIVLQAYLPDALRAMIELQQWAASRVFAGGAPIKVRVVKGANLPMERVDAELHGWPLATVSSKAEADANYKRVLNYALTADRVKNVKIGVAGHNLFDLAYAWLLAGQRGAQEGMDVEMLLGMAQAQSKAVQSTVGRLVLYTPVVHPQEFDVAIAYLIRRLEEGAAKENFLSSAFELENPEFFKLEQSRFLESLALIGDGTPIPNRLQDRHNDLAVAPAKGFENAPDTDPAISANRSWAYGIIAKAATSEIGSDLVDRDTVTSLFELNSKIREAAAAGKAWGSKHPLERAAYIHKAGVLLERNRAALIEVAMSETGKTLDQADAEISEAVDFAHYYAERCKELAELDGAVAEPFALTLVTPPWNFPVAIPAGGVLAALAAGAAVILKPAGLAARCGALLAEVLREAIPEDVLVSIQISESDLGRELIAHPEVDQVILTGGFETAQLFRSFKPDLRITAETSGKNAMIITPSADLDLAAKDLAYSAFGHAGQKCSAASIAILVGSVAKSERFRRQLIDAVSSMTVDYPSNPTAQIGPLISVPEQKLRTALTELQRGEKWLLQPRQLDDSGKLWSPGIRDHVLPGSPSHKVEYFGPMLAIMTAPNLQAAIALQNSVDYGLTAGIHSLDDVEVSDWLARVQAGNLYVNRGITGAIVQRQPFGGWKRSAIGPTTKAGGPNYLLSLTKFASAEAKHEEEIQNAFVEAALALAAESELTDAQMASLLRSAQSDQQALRERFGKATDVTGLAVERNVLRYHRSGCSLRISSSADDYSQWRSAISALSLGSVELSAFDVPKRLRKVLNKAGISVRIESDEAWLSRIQAPARWRYVGSKLQINAGSTLANCELTIYDNPVTESGVVELLPYLKEQAVSVTAHRFGNPNQLAKRITL